MNDKSIIGLGYKPSNAKAVCLKTDHETLLGDVEYKIIATPYERSFIKLHNPGGSQVRYDAMAVNILDPLTGLTYAVEYHPANLVRKDAESPQPAATESSKMDSAAYIEKISSYVKALDKIVKDNPEVENDCGVLINFNRIDEGVKTFTGGRLFGGNSRALRIGLEKACRENPEFYALLAKVVENAASGRTFDLTFSLGGMVCDELEVLFTKRPGKLIGRYYKPDFVQALNLETNMSAHLGNRKYRIISEPYVKKYDKPRDVVFDTMSNFWSTEHTWIEVIDSVTNNKYAVAFIPSGVCEGDDE